MVNYSSPALDATFSALADPTRRAILARLAKGESSVVELAEPFDFSLPAVLKHVRVLEDAGLLARQKDGRVNHCRLQPAPMKNAAAWIEKYRQFWEHQFDALAQFLEESQREEKKSRPRHSKARKTRSASAASSRRRARRSSKPGSARTSWKNGCAATRKPTT
jgi:DNA-binding transcriptional ArsR family regulator